MATEDRSKFDRWCTEVNEVCLRFLRCSWEDLCGDEEPLKQGFEDGLLPLEFTRGWQEKYDLDWYGEA